MKKLVWIDTIVDYPIYQDLKGTRLYNSSYDVSLPLAYVYLKTYIQKYRPEYEFIYHPRRLYKAEGRSISIDELVQDGDIVLTSCSTSDSYDARKILSVAKSKGKVTILGGIYPRFSHKEVSSWQVTDFIVRGEGEKNLLDVLDVISGRRIAPNPWPGVITSTQLLNGSNNQLLDLECLPQPDYSNLPINQFQKYMRSAYILATRGCPAPCHFCTSARLYGYSYRVRKIDSVINELNDLYSLGFKKITFADDTIAVKPDWCKELFKKISKVNPGYKLKVRVRADEINEDILDVMKDAGVEIVQFGVESISITTREMMYKKLNQNFIYKAFENVLKRGMMANPLYMLAYPGETWDDAERNKQFICDFGQDSNVITYVSFTTPYPDTGFSILTPKFRTTGLIGKFLP